MVHDRDLDPADDFFFYTGDVSYEPLALGGEPLNPAMNLLLWAIVSKLFYQESDLSGIPWLHFADDELSYHRSRRCRFLLIFRTRHEGSR